MTIIEIITITLLIFVISFLLWDKFKREHKLKEQGDALSKAVRERIDSSIQVFGDLKERLGELTQRTRDIQEMGKNISSLQDILRAPKPRGGLGELLLERLLADSLPKDYYDLQYRFRSSGVIVDAAVKIGENLVPIDAKFPLEDFERLTVAASEKERNELRRHFVNTVKKHIDSVAKYILPDESTFGFALMYVPAENIYYETICQSDIYAYCLQKRVFLVSPNSFNAYLQAIILGLNGLRIEKNAREIQGRLERLQGEFSIFQGDYDTLGGHIHRAAAKYEEASTRLLKLGNKLQISGEIPIKELPTEDSSYNENK